ncbi:hypothetical protein [Mongoliibacter ruber]|uniref:Uncharacterized protein n=1 Tax=Mongoliibacter ruber TaxID=1750599 RepID=A0A2T0WFM1_9BACT|nr:hypothetical protein [Mongoliibacter ruber]PRY85510.1 hypothetical protein CLW00_11291 [Mongoliibacter ruber]
MAEIRIEKESPKWPWILLILAVVAVLIYVFAFNGTDDQTDERMQQDRNEETTGDFSDTSHAAANNSVVAVYVDYIKDDPDQMGLDHDFTNEALIRLEKATNAMADEIGYDIKKDMDEARTHAVKITKDPFETTHANSIRKSAEILAEVLQNIQERAFSGLANEANEVKNAATAIDPEVLTLDQKEDIKNFFRESADLLEKMNNNAYQMQNHVREQ